MERSNFFSDQLVLSDDLNNIESTKADQLTLRALANALAPGGWGKNSTLNSASVLAGGMFGSPADYLNTSKNCSVTIAGADTLAVAAGNALSPDGELIVVPSVLTVTRAATGANFQWTSCPLIANYVKLRYVETSGSFKADDVGTQFPTRYNDSYWVQVDDTPPATTELLLAQFMAGAGGDVGVGGIADKRLYVRNALPADSVYLDPTVKPVSAHATVEDHVRSVGTGVPSPTNPHGLTVADLGSLTGIPEHIAFQHDNGLYFLGSKTLAALASYTASVVTISGYAAVAFGAASNAALAIGGTIFSGSIAPLSTVTAPSTGVFDIVVNSSGTASWITTGSSHPTNPNDLHAVTDSVWLAQAVITESAPGLHDLITVLDDKRQCYTLAPGDIRGVDESVSAASLTQSSSLYDALARIRNQVGVALSGVGSSWAPGSPNPLTAGPASNADAYHVHSTFNYTQFHSGSADPVWGGTTTPPAFANDNRGGWIPEFGEIYQNTASHPLFVTASFYVELVGDGTLGDNQVWVDARIGSSSPPTGSVGTFYRMAQNFATWYLYFVDTLSFIIPANFYYQLSSGSEIQGASTVTLGIRSWNWYS